MPPPKHKSDCPTFAGYSALELVDAGLEIRNELLWRGVRQRGSCGRWILSTGAHLG